MPSHSLLAETVPPLLDPDEPPAVTVANPEGPAAVLIVCDHAANRVPRRLARLGLPDAELERHIGWDIGAADVSLHMAHRLGAPAVLAGYSRLVVDLNRRLDDPTLMPDISDGTRVPGNANLPPTERQARLEALFHPYHDRIRTLIARRRQAGHVPALISIHSFTPVMAGFARPWHVGVLWNRDPRIALPLLQALRAEDGLVVGDNEPYSARGGCGYTLQTHAEAAGLPAVMVEIRHDLIATASGAAIWAERLARLLAPILADPALAETRFY